MASNPSEPPPPSSEPTDSKYKLIPKLEPRKRRSPPTNPTPVPQTPALPPRPDTTISTSTSTATSAWHFKTPSRRILSRRDHDLFLASPTKTLVVAWVFSLADAVVDTPRSHIKDEEEEHLGDSIRAILGILDEVQGLIEQNPPDEQLGSRFGNKAFRGFLDAVRDNSHRWHTTLLGQDDGGGGDAAAPAAAAAIAEVSTYFIQSFGNRNRIDYGSGHELNFAMWLLCLYQLRRLQPSDFKALVLRVFARYLVLMRAVQMTYYLEPAGSHGVWGLDDYQFLPFLFGASQLLHHPYITPRSIHQDLTIEEFAHEFLYLDQVGFVNSTKTVKGLRWHSPMLDDISSAKSWSKIDGGMRRMFIAEVLGKLPVMQHFLFGSLIPPAQGMTEESSYPADDDDDDDEREEQEEGEEQGHHGHTHGPSDSGVGWGDCCGIKVPSSIAAAQEAKKGAKGESLRRIPFD